MVDNVVWVPLRNLKIETSLVIHTVWIGEINLVKTLKNVQLNYIRCWP